MQRNGKTRRTNSNTLSAESGIYLCPLDADPLAALAGLILKNEANNLPDMGHCTILLPSIGAAQQLRRTLLGLADQAGHTALIPPTICTLTTWLREQSQSQRDILTETARERILLEALQDMPQLTERYGHWALVDSLLPLFDELALNGCPLPDSYEDFEAHLYSGYGLSGSQPAPFIAESRLVFQLWQAWQATLKENQLLDEATSTLAALADTAAHIDNCKIKPLYLAGFIYLDKAIISWLEKMLSQGRATMLIQHKPATSAPYSENHPLYASQQLIEALPPKAIASTGNGHGITRDYLEALSAAFASPETPLAVRAKMLVSKIPQNPIGTLIRLHKADDVEAEARTIDIQVRQWRLAGIKSIGIVTNDRRLGRRLRALLERAGLALDDEAGWTLSTTSAAAAVARWIDCLVLDFDTRTLSALLDSPFHTLLPDDDMLRLEMRKTLALLQAKHGPNRGLDTLKRQIEGLHTTLQCTNTELNSDQTGNADVIGGLLDLIMRLKLAARGFLTDQRSASGIIDDFASSIEQIGMHEQLMLDNAGIEVLREIGALKASLGNSRLKLSRQALGDWLKRCLEKSLFRPSHSQSGITLTSFAGSRVMYFDALIIAGAHAQQLPGAHEGTPLFNDGVRRELGLPTSDTRYNELHYDFYRLLAVSPQTLISWPSTIESEDVGPSPWVERLQHFFELAYKTNLYDTNLAQLAHDKRAQVKRCNLPAPAQTTIPAPAAPRLPAMLTASSYQRLIDCPYRFFAQDCLELKALDHTDEELDKAGYGRLVHRVLEAFHQKVAGLPGPFEGQVNKTNLDAAHALLRNIADAVFSAHISADPLTAAWRYRLDRTFAPYLEWLIEHARTWQTREAELHLERTLPGAAPKLGGRIDRLDQNKTGLAVIDYKTGAVPRTADIERGESVQLPFYAMLTGADTNCCMALELGDGRVRIAAELKGELLAALKKSHLLRLNDLFEKINQGTGLAAWGQDQVCRYCDYENLCRKQMHETAN